MAKSLKTLSLDASSAGVKRAAEILRDGGLVAFPTETVYGLGADATNGTAVARIFEAKQRPTFNPLIAHVPNLEAAERVCVFSAKAKRLAEAFWPGALTLVLPLRPEASISPLVAAGGAQIAVRIPGASIARDLLIAAGAPVAAPSANPSGKISPTTAEHVWAGLGGQTDAILDAGPCTVGIESTIVMPEPVATLLRSGGIPVEDLETCLGEKLASPSESGPPVSPGQLASHYAPEASVRLNALAAKEDEFMIGFGPVPGDINLSATADLTEAAANLFQRLHQANMTSRPIAIAPIPETGLGRAINDRLRRAAAPRG